MRILLFLAACVFASAQDIPRPEFPQPQFEREQWQSLNGKWEFEFDDASEGLVQDWASGARKFSRTIIVPYAFETAKSGIADPSFHPVVWYRRAFTVPADWKGRRVLLHFGAVFYTAQVWVNGRSVGAHEGGNVPFAFDVTPYLKSGANTVTVRAENYPTDRSIPRGKQFWEVKSKSIFYTRTSGIWQPVWLEAAGDSYLERVRITPANDGTVKFEAVLARPRPGIEFSAAVIEDGKTLAGATTATSGPRASASATVLEPKHWSPDHPRLYNVTFELRQGGQVVDRVRSYFGFRIVRVEDSKVTINGDPAYLKFVLDQGYWPESNLTPPTDEAIKYDIRMAKEMGFNGARKHQKLEDPRFLYWADKMGFLVSSEMANSYEYNDTYVQRFTREWQEAVERDYNHPSIIIWVPINESWGVPDLHDPRQVAHQVSMYQLTKALDSTRLVIDNDGWEHTNMTDLFAIHDYDATGAGLRARYKNLVPGKPAPDFPRNYRPALVSGFGYNGAPLYLSEWGGIAYIPEGAKVPGDSWGYAGVMKTQEAALQRLTSLFEAINALPFVGHCYTQLTDVEQEINGLMTYDRKPKFDVKKIKELNDSLRFQLP